MLVGLEFGLGICFLFSIAIKESGWVGLLILCAFSGYLIWRISIGDEDNCHCFGDSFHLTPKESLIKNGVLTLFIIPCLFHKPSSREKRLVATLIATAAVIVSAFICIPDFLTKTEKAQDLVDEELFEDFLNTTDYSQDDVFVSFLSLNCKYCQKYMKKLRILVSRGGIPDNQVHLVIMDDGIHDGDVEKFFSEYGDGYSPPYLVLPPERFLPIVYEMMPTGVFVKKGVIEEAVDLISLGR